MGGYPLGFVLRKPVYPPNRDRLNCGGEMGPRIAARRAELTPYPASKKAE
jgi:hypothetical protein